MGKATKEQLSPIDVHAESTVTREARKHAEYARIRFTERGTDGGEMSGSRMRRVAPVRGLERIRIAPHLMLAANLYDYCYLGSLGQCNHEMREYIDKPFRDRVAEISAGGAMVQKVKKHLMRNDSLDGVFMCGLLRRLFETNRDDSLAKISCPNYDDAPKWKRKRAAENNVPRVITLLEEVATVFGVST